MASSNSNFSSVSSSSSAMKPTIFGFFANTPGDTLKEKMLAALLNQLGTIDHFEKCLLENPGLDQIFNSTYGKRLRFRLNTLCNYLARGEKKEAEDFLKANLRALPILLKLRTTVKTPEGFTLYERTAAQIAMSAKDVGREGCDLYLSSNAEPTNTDLKKLFLYNNGDENSPFTYIIHGTEHTIVRGTAEGQLTPNHFDTLKAMYSAPLMNKALNLSYEGLTEAQCEAYSALLYITKTNGHTEFVKEEGTKQMLQRYYNQLPDGEAEFEKQRQAQFPEGWKELSKQDKKELENVFKAIARSGGDIRDRDCAAAIQHFKDYLTQKLATPVTTGFYSNDELLIKAFELLHEYAHDNTRWNGSRWCGYWSLNSNLVFNHVIGPIESTLAAHAGMAIAQGISYQLVGGEKLRRDPGLRVAPNVSYISFFSHPGWINGDGSFVWSESSAIVALTYFSSFFSSQNKLCAELMPRSESRAYHCVIL